MAFSNALCSLCQSLIDAPYATAIEKRPYLFIITQRSYSLFILIIYRLSQKNVNKFGKEWLGSEVR